MDYDSTEAAVAEHQNDVQAVEQAEAVQSDTESAPTEKAESPKEPASHKEAWPKSAVNAFNKKNQKIHKLEREIAELKSKIAPIPNEDSWDKSYAELLEAKTVASVENKFTERQIEALSAQKEQVEQEFFAERFQESSARAAEYKQSISDYESTLTPYAPAINSASPEMLQLLFSANDPALASYGLAKLGILHEVLQMPPQLATAYIAQGELYGRQQKLQATPVAQQPQLPAQQASVAPRPIEVSGSPAGGGVKDPLKMSKEEFSRWLNS